MRRRIKTKRKSAFMGKKLAKAKEDFRFKISLVFLIAMISASAYLFLFSLSMRGENLEGNPVAVKKLATTNPVRAGIKSSNEVYTLDDSALDFKLIIPPGFGQWIYRVGFVRSLVDYTLSNQFLKVYVSTKNTGNPTSFDECYREILAIRRFSVEEWKDLEKSCKKGNSFLCNEAGVKLGEKDKWVWAYTKSESCSQDEQEEKDGCTYVQRIVESFQLK